MARLIDPIHVAVSIELDGANVGGKRVAHASESPTPPTLRTSTDVYLNNAIM